MTPLGFLALPFLASLLIVLTTGGRVIAALAARKARQPISGDAPAAHQAKQGTPTMGGLLILAATGLSVIACLVGYGGFIQTAQRTRVWAVLLVFLFAGLIGLMDDLGKARKKQNKAGLSERAKLALQLLVAGGFALFLGLTERSGITTVLPLGSHSVEMGLAYYGLAILYITLFGNAVNFTDGLDGLAGGTTLIASVALGATLGGTVAPAAPEVGLFYGALAGACAGFLCFNTYPARVFMGDTGSLALGMGLAAAALVAKQEILFLVIGLVYLAEIAAMMIQRYVFKYRRIRYGIDYAKAHRVFRRAPLHHHFEELGWPETQVVARFWVAGLAAAALAFALLSALSFGVRGGTP